eukprot:scaffold2229_cov262-Pinguiococcus_pyrenoidosus.AAC.9
MNTKPVRLHKHLALPSLLQRSRDPSWTTGVEESPRLAGRRDTVGRQDIAALLHGDRGPRDPSKPGSQREERRWMNTKSQRTERRDDPIAFAMPVRPFLDASWVLQVPSSTYGTHKPLRTSRHSVQTLTRRYRAYVIL